MFQSHVETIQASEARYSMVRVQTEGKLPLSVEIRYGCFVRSVATTGDLNREAHHGRQDLFYF